MNLYKTEMQTAQPASERCDQNMGATNVKYPCGL